MPETVRITTQTVTARVVTKRDLEARIAPIVAEQADALGQDMSLEHIDVLGPTTILIGVSSEEMYENDLQRLAQEVADRLHLSVAVCAKVFVEYSADPRHPRPVA